MKLWFWIAFLVASFTALTYGQTVTDPQSVTVASGRIIAGPVRPLAPADAARVMMGPAMQSNRTEVPQQPRTAGPSVVVPSTPGAAYWLPMPKPAEPRRLDGTPLSSPPATYGGSTLLIIEAGR